MKKWRGRFMAMAMAVAYAEEGEWDSAALLLDKYEPKDVNAIAGKAKRVEQRQRSRTCRV